MKDFPDFLDPEDRRWCFLSAGQSSGSSQSTGSGQSMTLPGNLQNAAFTNLSPYTAGALYGAAQDPGALQGIAPTSVNGEASNNPDNPLVAQVTAPQQATLGGIGNLVNALPGTLGGAFGTLNSEVQPGFAAGLATSPQTQAAISSAIAPIQQTFNTQTVPGLEGSFTQAGQRVGSASGQGSSAFDNAFASAQGNEIATEASTAGSIANNAYQTGLNITANAPSQIANLSSSELTQMISGLNAQALPQLTQQYGISAATQLYQNQISTILQALGLQVQGEQPAIGYGSESTSNEQSTGQNSSSQFGFSPAGTISAFNGG